MSMDLYVFSDARLASIAEWQEAIDAEKFDLQLSNEIALSQVDGFLPARLHGRQTGFECNHWDAGELIAGLKPIIRISTWNDRGSLCWRSAGLDRS